MNKVDILREIESIRKSLRSDYEGLERTERMYPPDGGGHGYKWRMIIEKKREEIDDLRAKIDRLQNERTEVYRDDNFDETCRLIIPDFQQISDELIEYFSKNPAKLQDLKWWEFEDLLAVIFRNQGYDTELGPGRGDGGVDLRLIHKDSIGEILTLVQAKKHKMDNPIRLEAVQALYAVVEDRKANRGLFVTTSRYLPSAEQFAERQKHRLTIAKSEDVGKWCQYIIERRKQNR